MPYRNWLVRPTKVPTAQVDTELIGHVAASIQAFNAREAFISSLSQTKGLLTHIWV